jgi:hypothetical protein
MYAKDQFWAICIYSELYTVAWEHSEQAIDTKTGGVIDELKQLSVRFVPSVCGEKVNEEHDHYFSWLIPSSPAFFAFTVILRHNSARRS